MKLLSAIFLAIATWPSQAVTLELPDYSYICFSHQAVFSDKLAMLQTLKCVNTIGKERLKQLTYNNDDTWSAILYIYNTEIRVFGKISVLRSIT